MATIIDQQGHSHNVASNAKANAGLTTGIIGTSLAGLNILGGLGNVLGMFGGKKPSCDPHAVDMSAEDLYLERKQSQDRYDALKEFCSWRMDTTKQITDAFFLAYQRDRDSYDALNNKFTDASFALYKNQRDEKDELNEKICSLQRQVDVMSAIRPYQDALINAKIDNNAMVSEFNLAKRTCRMIEGQLVLPNTPEVTGYTSYNPFNIQNG